MKKYITERIGYFVLLFIFITSISKIKGQDIEYSSPTLFGNIMAINDTTSVIDDEVLAPTGFLYNNNGMSSGVLLRMNYDEACSYPFTVTLELEVQYNDTLFSTPQTKNISMTLSYDPSAAKTTNDRVIYYVPASRRVRAKIVSITSSLGGTTVPTYVVLETFISRERHYSLNPSTTTTFNTIDNSSNTDQLKISWGPIDGAQEYDLEWVFVDDYKDYISSTHSYFTQSQLKYTFRNNSTRITTKQPEFIMKNLYEHGYLLFRVRAVSRFGVDFKQRWEGVWSGGTESGDVDDFGTINKNKYQITVGHEDELNWQWTTTFAEEAKYKLVVSYFDGGLRSRQTVTHNNSDSFTIVGESMYDHVGRKAIDALPVPTGEREMKYYDAFNNSIVSHDPYSWKDFELVSGTACINTLVGMDTLSGASQYYSNHNPDKDGFQAYVPKAFNYPFVQTEYTPDMTGKVRRQSGVGVDHKMESGHETKYFYGVPGSQQELDALFGVEVGYYQHYKKEMTVDANGSVSVSYMNPGGKVIATALAGKNPANLTALPTDTAKRILTQELIYKNVSNADSNSWTTSHEFMLPQSSAVSVEYKLADLRADIGCGSKTICYDCLYDLKVELVDQCGNQIFNEVRTGIKVFDDSCNVLDTFRLGTLQTILPQGSYQLVKTLSINEQAMLKYEDTFMNYNNCVPSVNDLYDSLVALIDTSDCYLTCESCIEGLGTESEYIETKLLKTPYGYPRNRDSLGIVYTQLHETLCTSYGGPPYCHTYIGYPNNFKDSLLLIDSLQRDSIINMLSVKFSEEWEYFYEDCMELCDTVDECEVQYNLLLQDVSPGGQYFEYDLVYDTTAKIYMVSTTSYNLSLIHDAPDLPVYPLTTGATRNYENPNIIYYNDDGSLSYIMDGAGILRTPNEYPADTFLANWKKSWAASLVKLHPEYCYYEFCIEQMQNANKFDRLMMYAETFDDAKAKRLLNPIHSVNVWAYDKDSSSFDLFYETGEPGNWKESDMIAKCNDYSDGRSIWELAVINAFCPYAKTNLEMNDCVSAHAFGTGTDAQKDLQWATFRGLYRAQRQKHIEESRTNNANSGHCTNCYIGHLGNTVSPCTDTYFTSSSLIDKQRIYVNNDHAVGVDGSASDEDIMDQGISKVKAATETNCSEQCNAYAEYWMGKLEDCEWINPSDSATVRARLIAICIEGCDIDNPFGSSSVPPGSASTYQNFEDVLLSVGIPLSSVCNAELLTMPLEYGHDYQASGFVKMDDCFEAKMDGLTIGCVKTRESLLLDSIFSFIYSIDSSVISPTPIRDSVFSNDLRNSIKSVLAPYFYVNENQLNYYYTSIDGSGNLIIHFQGSYGMEEKECTIKIYKPAEHSSSFFEDIGLIYGFQGNINTCSSPNASVIVEYFGEPYFLDADVGCFNLCNNSATNNLIRQKFIEDYCVTMTLENIDLIRKYRCGDTTALPYIPRDLSCKSSCITCDKLLEAELAFKEKYDVVFDMDLNAKGHIDIEGGNLELEENFTTVFNTFMNQYFNFNMTYDDYLRLKQNCEKYYKATVSYGGDGSYAVYSQVNFQKIKNGCTWPYGLDSAYMDTLFNLLSMCNEPLLVRFPIIQLTCDSLKRIAAYQEALTIREDLLRKARAEFRIKYLQQCRLAPKYESFRLTYTMQEYHYTLYYYDQAGNLVKTVPPAGVDYITNSSKLAQIVTDRKAITAPSSANTPLHTLATQYKYNTLNQVYQQSTPDGGISDFYYDKLGRMVVSQNAKQAAVADDIYSFTQYDNLGRIYEVGQINAASAMTDVTAKAPNSLSAWINNADGVDNVTRTVYDDTANGYGNFFGGKQQNLRNRVSYMYTVREFLQYPDYPRPETEVYTLYSYDLHGNVKTLIQDIRALSLVSENDAGRYRIDYEYDLISGNVHQVSYQAGKQDRFFHRYLYDGDNRLVTASTSRDGIFYENDATYFYYKHGPLARVETGELKVQGTDYAYTIHGWLKGVNSGALDSTRDMGKDSWANINNLNRYIPKDLFGFTLGYYNGDYHQIQPINDPDKFEIQYTASQAWDNASPSLYNGNIRNMVTAIGKFMEGNGRPMGYAYKYDHLNRLASMHAWDSVDMGTNTWVDGMNVKSDFHNRFTYDANGNIMTQVRRGSMAKNIALDSLTYHYYSNTNRLSYVSDGINAANYHDDIDNQSSANYQYDAIGNLIYDRAEEIDTIKWNVYGKITDIIRSPASVKPNLQFAYGPDGQRISKKVIWADSIKTEYYVRDAQGNIMATYTERNPYFANNIDSSYNAVLALLIDSIGIEGFAEFIMNKYKDDLTFNGKVSAYLPSLSALDGLTLDDIRNCYGDRLFDLVFDCCDGCDDANARKLMNDIMNSSSNYLNALLECNLEKVLLAMVTENSYNFFNDLDVLIGFSSPLAGEMMTQGYQNSVGPDIDFLLYDVPPEHVVNYMLNHLGWLMGTDQNSINEYIKYIITNLSSEAAVAIQKHIKPCDFLKCIGSCIGTGSGTSCSNNFTSYLNAAFNEKRVWSPEPDINYVRSVVVSSGVSFSDLVNCDAEALMKALLERNAYELLDYYMNTYGGNLLDITNYFITVYPPDFPNPDDRDYLSSRIPKAELAAYLIYYMNTYSGGYWSILSDYINTHGINVDELVRDYYQDCDIKKCIIETNIVTASYTPVSLTDYLKNQLGYYTLSNAIYCNPGLNTGKIQQSFLDNFSNLKISQCGGPDLFTEGMKNIPYIQLLNALNSTRPNEAFDKLIDCDPQQMMEMLYDYDIRLFVEEAKNAFGGTLCNAFPAYGPAPYNFSSQCEEYLRAIVPRHVLIDYIVNHLGPGGMGSIMTAFEGHYPNRMYEILFKGFSECSFKNCATTHWPQMGYYEDSSEIFDYLRNQKWTGILQQVRGCYKDSFNYYFAKTYPGFVAEIFESWHYPLIGFMDDIEDYFDTTMRNKLDGDTLIELQYYVVNEFHLYGSSRLGIYEANDTTIKVTRLYNFSRSENEINYRFSTNTTKYNKFATDSSATLMHGNKKYEGTNHLGNVLVVYSDKRLIGACNADTALYYKADLLAAYEYSPFGAPIKQWYANDDTSGYKFGFNGQEKDNEVSGAGNSMTAEYWQYDSRLGRRWNVDPVVKPWESGYATFSNNPIIMTDVNGDDSEGGGDNGITASSSPGIAPNGDIVGGINKVFISATIGKDKDGNDINRVIGIQDGENSYIWNEEKGWYTDSKGNSYNNPWHYDITNAVGKMIKPLAQMSIDWVNEGDPLYGIKQSYLESGSGSWGTFFAKSFTEGIYESWADFKAGGYKRQQLLLTMFVGITSSGAAPSALFPVATTRNIFQDILAIKRLKGNTEIASGTVSDAISIGKAWVNGNNIKLIKLKDGIGWTDGTRSFRLSVKKNGKFQANFQENTVSLSGKISQTKNVHMDIKK